MRISLIFFTSLFFSPLAFAETDNGEWHIGIGDPTLFGWLTVIFYGCAAYFSLKQYRQLQQTIGDAKFWLYLAILLMLLGFNKQLDLQTLFTQLLRSHAIANEWYEKRRMLQSAFIVFLGVAMMVTLLSLRVLLAKSWQQYKLAWMGIILLCTFVLMRAASFHNFDGLINANLFGLRMNVILEVGTLSVIIIAALKSYQFGEGERGSVSKYLKIQSDEDTVQCPKCAFPPISKAVDRRRFKCKQCGHQYTVIIST